MGPIECAILCRLRLPRIRKLAVQPTPLAQVPGNPSAPFKLQLTTPNPPHSPYPPMFKHVTKSRKLAKHQREARLSDEDSSGASASEPELDSASGSGSDASDSEGSDSDSEFDKDEVEAVEEEEELLAPAPGYPTIEEAVADPIAQPTHEEGKDGELVEATGLAPVCVVCVNKVLKAGTMLEVHKKSKVRQPVGRARPGQRCLPSPGWGRAGLRRHSRVSSRLSSHVLSVPLLFGRTISVATPASSPTSRATSSTRPTSPLTPSPSSPVLTLKSPTAPPPPPPPPRRPRPSPRLRRRSWPRRSRLSACRRSRRTRRSRPRRPPRAAPSARSCARPSSSATSRNAAPGTKRRIGSGLTRPGPSRGPRPRPRPRARARRRSEWAWAWAWAWRDETRRVAGGKWGGVQAGLQTRGLTDALSL